MAVISPKSGQLTGWPRLLTGTVEHTDLLRRGGGLVERVAGGGVRQQRGRRVCQESIDHQVVYDGGQLVN